MKTFKTNLIISLTPLQALIGCKIIDMFANEDFFCLSINLKSNKTYDHYNKKIAEKCVKSWIIKRNQYSKIGDLLTFRDFKKKYSKEILSYTYDKIFFASVDESIIQYIIKHATYNNICSFDDGFYNLENTGPYFEESTTLSYKFKKMLFNTSFNLVNLKKKISRHYTLFDNNPFVDSSKTEKIDLFSLQTKSTDHNSPVKRIFVGQPMIEISDHLTPVFLKDILAKLNIDFYYPHPRENEDHHSYGKQIIQSQLIFEEYILEYLNGNPDEKIEIYSIFSTILLTMSAVGIDCFYLTDEILNSRYIHLFNLMDEYKVKRLEISN